MTGINGGEPPDGSHPSGSGEQPPATTGPKPGAASVGSAAAAEQAWGEPTHRRARLKLIVLDDDPTGSQTVHSCPLLLRWDAATLLEGLRHPSPLLFLLANTRALDPDAARARVGEIARGLAAALDQALNRGWIDGWQLISRGDSTLRGHYPLEVEVLEEVLGPFDATLLAPAFLEGGRSTRDAVHRLHGQPVHETPFARDGLFGFRHSDLRCWVEEKSGGRIPAASVEHLNLGDLEGPGEALTARLRSLQDNATVAVDAETPAHLQALATALRQLCLPLATAPGEAPLPTGAQAAAASPGPRSVYPPPRPITPAPGTDTEQPPSLASPSGSVPRPRRFLIQSAAGLVGALADLPPQPLDGAGLAALRRQGPAGPLAGLVLVGSHVPLADAQLERLLADPGCTGLELPVDRLLRVLEGPLPDRLLASLEAEWLAQLQALLAAGSTPVLFTSRGERSCRHAAERRALGLALADLMGRLGGALAPQLGYLISKGGITTHTLLADGLAVDSVQLQGQLLPGLSLVLAGPQALPVLTFPGNLGDAATLHQAWQLMEQGGLPPELQP